MAVKQEAKCGATLSHVLVGLRLKLCEELVNCFHSYPPYLQKALRESKRVARLPSRRFMARLDSSGSHLVGPLDLPQGSMRFYVHLTLEKATCLGI